MNTDIVIGMAGSGGDGIVSAGESIIAAAARDGYHAMMTKSFGPQIRGGESSCRVRLSTERLFSPNGALSVAVALNWEDFLKFGAELKVDGSTVVVYESKTGVDPTALPLPGIVPAEVFSVPIAELARTSCGTEKAKTSVVLGLLSGWLGLASETLLAGLGRKFAKKGEELVTANEKAFAAGHAYALEHPMAKRLTLAPPPEAGPPKLLTDGNDMTAAAAIFAGCQFFSGYPITPSTEIMQLLGREIWKYGGTVLQAEDEIAGIGAAVGASFAGKKAMTATSGPGMSLKTEIIGLASIAELPLVIVNVQRGGPSTGIPTKPEQSDLFQACFSAHGDSLRPVLAPTCVADCFDVTVAAFNIAELYQTPVIVLSDQEIGQRKETVDLPDTSRFTIAERTVPHAGELDGYRRFRDCESGVSPISHPGMLGGAYLASGIEHNESGAPTASGAIHAEMTEKRFRKLDPLKTRDDLVRIEGDQDAPLALVSWGSVAGICHETVALAKEQGLRVKLISPYLLYPVPDALFTKFFRSVQAGFVVEQSHQGQLYRLLRMFVDVPSGVRPLCRSAALPFGAAEILARLQEAAYMLQRRVSDSRPPQE